MEDRGDPVKVLLVDDHTLFRTGLKMLLEKEADISLVADVADAESALDIISQKQVDVVLMDISLPGLDGLQATGRIKEQYPEVKVIILTMHNVEPYLLKALEVNASGYLVKEAASTELVSAIRGVMQGETIIHPSLVKVLVNVALKDKQNSGGKEQERTVLTEREKEVLRNVCLGYTNQEIADKLVVSVRTVEKHKSNIMEKLNLNHRHQLVYYAIKNGLVKLTPE